MSRRSDEYEVVVRLRPSPDETVFEGLDDKISTITFTVSSESEPPLKADTRMAVWYTGIRATAKGWGLLASGSSVGAPALLSTESSGGDGVSAPSQQASQNWVITMSLRSVDYVQDDYSSVWTEATGVLAQIIWSDETFVRVPIGTLDKLAAQIRKGSVGAVRDKEVWTRAAVERIVTQHFQDMGSTVTESLDSRYGYDLLVGRADGSAIAVEVKTFLGEPEPRDVQRVREATPTPDLPASVSGFLIVAVVLGEETERVETLLWVDTPGATR